MPDQWNGAYPGLYTPMLIEFVDKKEAAIARKLADERAALEEEE